MTQFWLQSARLKIAMTAIAVSAATATCADAAPALYSSQQAGDGQAVFTQNCASCHGAALQGGVGPTLIGQNFSAASDKNTVGSIFSFMSSQMPDGSGGSLSHTQYEDVMAYLLSKNGYPAGSARLDFTNTLTSKVPLISQVK